MSAFIKLNPYNNVGANQTATVNLANLFGWTVDRIILTLGGTFTKAQISDIRIKANGGKVIWQDSGSRTDSRMQYRGIGASATQLAIDFSELRSKTIVGQKIGSIDTTAGIQSLSMEVDIGGATGPTLSGYAEVSEPQVNGDGVSADYRGLIAKVFNTVQSFAGAARYPLDLQIGRKNPCLVKRIHLFGASINSVEVKKNGISVFEDLPAALNTFELAEWSKTVQASHYPVDFIRANNQSDALLITPQDGMQYYVTTAAATTITTVVETYNELGRDN